jgi:hypothetical protein
VASDPAYRRSEFRGFDHKETCTVDPRSAKSRRERGKVGPQDLFQVSRQSDHVSTLPPKANKDKMIPDKKQRYQKMEQQMPRRRPSFRYQNFFHGYCFYCSNFGHKIANCQIKFRDMQLRRSRNKQSLQHRTKQPMSRQSCTNHFDLLNNELECYNCHNFGHKAANCHLKNYKADPRIKPLARNASTWKKKGRKMWSSTFSSKTKEPLVY